jgi:hypothetical protein
LTDYIQTQKNGEQDGNGPQLEEDEDEEEDESEPDEKRPKTDN